MKFQNLEIEINNMTKKILVIDDEQNFCNLVAKYLSKQGYKALTAYNGEEGFNLVIAEKPDLIILDIIMPEMDGIDFFRKLEETNNNIPVIVISGDTL